MILRQLPHAHFVARFDLKHYDQSMRHEILFSIVRSLNLSDKTRRDIITFVHHSAPQPGRGIRAGNALAPLLGAVM